jgi:hypothetical protein
MWKKTPLGTNSMWVNDGSGNFDNVNGSSFVTREGSFFSTQEIGGGGGFSGLRFTLPGITLFGNSGTWASQIQQFVYNNSPYYQNSGNINFSNTNAGGFGISNGAGFSSGGGSSAGGSFVSGSGNNTNSSTTYYGNYVGPGSDIIDPRHMRFVLKIEPVDIIDLAAYYHDIAYFDAGVGGVDGALNSIRVLEADKNLAIQAYVVMGMFWRGDTDPMTKKPVSFETFMWARGVFNLFGSISIYKQHRVNQYNATINNH